MYCKICSKNEPSTHEIVKKEKELCASFAVALHTAKVMATMGAKCLVKLEKALNLWVEDTSRKDALIDGNVLHRTALNLCQDFSKGSPGRSDTVLFTAREGWLHRPRNRFGSKDKKLTREAVTTDEEAAATFPAKVKLIRV